MPMMPVTSGFDWRESSYSSSRDGNYAETALSWRKSSYSGGQGGNCVEVAESATGAAMRDTKHRDLGTLTFPTCEWRALLGASKLQEPS